MSPFSLPLSQGLDFSLDSDGNAFFKSWDGRSDLRMTPIEFMAMFSLLDANREVLNQDMRKFKKPE